MITPISHITRPGGRYHYFPHLVDEKAGPGWDYVTFPNLHSEKGANLETSPGSWVQAGHCEML